MVLGYMAVSCIKTVAAVALMILPVPWLPSVLIKTVLGK